MKQLSIGIGAALLAAGVSIAPTFAKRAVGPSDLPMPRICGAQVADRFDGTFKTGPETEIRYWIAIIGGHLYAADQLIAAGRTSEALPHLDHPLDEVIPAMGPMLQRYGLDSLGDDLKQLKAAIGAEDFQPLLKAVSTRLAATLERLPPEQRSALDRNAELLAALVDQSSKEFDEAWVGLKINNLVEYQDAAGFHREAVKLFTEMKPALAAKNPKIAMTVERSLNDMAKAWPSIDPPAKPEFAASAVRGLARVVELNLSRAAAQN
jgi:hypothetical protein